MDVHGAPLNRHSRGKNCYMENPSKSGFKPECDTSVNVFSKTKARFDVKSVFFSVLLLSLSWCKLSVIDLMLNVAGLALPSVSVEHETHGVTSSTLSNFPHVNG